MALWFPLALMTAAAVFIVLWPLGRARLAPASRGDVAVYRDQMRELERDRTAGLIGAGEADAARVEISRRLLAAADAEGEASPASVAPWRRRFIAVAALLALPLGVITFYLALGFPGLPDQPLAARTNGPENRSIAALVAQVEDRLERNPQDGRGWEVIGPVYMRLGRFDDAVRARRNALRLLGASAAREGDLGEALVAAANGVVTAEAKSAFDHALALDAHDARAKFFTGVAAQQDGKNADAAAIWRDLLAQAPADAPWANVVRQSLARLENPVPQTAAPGPSNADVAAAADMSPEARTQMVRGMVERLAQRLARDGSDLDGWVRLVRAYFVLGEHQHALDAAADARRALAGDQDKLHQFDAALTDLAAGGNVAGVEAPK
ncbi:MAG: c-type cytochrome biogenesis protein CcmI [Bradyrhizobiaceae bacterium]|nr:c-type cytochrome biogenesis protein CcmI [Hyphomicrobiales bacterium]MBV9426142.1 c-type cytochrome biogenesis protein CcmI [Bradyrhizobiaceae bacterium]